MLDFLKIPEQCICTREIPMERVFGSSGELARAVSSLIWYAVLRPENTGAAEYITTDLRYENILIIVVDISDPNHIYDVAQRIYEQIPYADILAFHYSGNCEKYLLSASRFYTGKREPDENIVKSIVMSHWIHPDCISQPARQFIDTVNKALLLQTDLHDIYAKIRNAIIQFHLKGTSRAHVFRLVDDMCGHGKCSTLRGRSTLLQYCTPYEYHAPSYVERRGNYTRIERASNYTLVHDYEDVWYCFMMNEDTRNVVLGRGYRDMEELIYRIDSRQYDTW